jgi:hypothetical protein
MTDRVKGPAARIKVKDREAEELPMTFAREQEVVFKKG